MQDGRNPNAEEYDCGRLLWRSATAEPLRQEISGGRHAKSATAYVAAET